MAAPASAAEAVDMVLDGLGYLAAIDPAALAAEAQARCLQALEQGDAISTAARARILAVFAAGQNYSDDADYSPTSWLIPGHPPAGGRCRSSTRLPSGSAMNAIRTPASGDGPGGMTGGAPHATARS